MKKIDRSAIYRCLIPYSTDLDQGPVVSEKATGQRGRTLRCRRRPTCGRARATSTKLLRSVKQRGHRGSRCRRRTQLSRASRRPGCARRDIEVIVDGNRRVVKKGDTLAQDDIIKVVTPDAVEVIQTEG